MHTLILFSLVAGVLDYLEIDDSPSMLHGYLENQATYRKLILIPSLVLNATTNSECLHLLESMARHGLYSIGNASLSSLISVAWTIHSIP